MLQQSHLVRNQPQGRKRRLFRFFHSVLEHYSFHANIYYLLLVIEVLQLANYGLHSSFGVLWNTPFSNGVRVVLSYSDLCALWEQLSPVGLLAFNAIIILANATALGFTLYEVEKDPRKLEKPNIPAIKFVTIYAVFLKGLLLIPLALALTAFANPSGFGLSGGEQVALGLLSVAGLLLAVPNLLLYIFFVRDNSPFSKLPFACSVTNQEELRCALKVALGVYGSLSAGGAQGGAASEVFSVVVVVSMGGLCYYSFSKACFVDGWVGKLQEGGYVAGAWLGACALAQLQVGEQDGLGFVLCMLGLLLAGAAWRAVRGRRAEELATANYKALHSSTQCLLYNYECIRHANQLGQLESLQFLEGMLNFHLMHCKKSLELCVCLQVREQLLQRRVDREREQLQSERRLWFQFIRSNLSEVREKYEGQTEIRFLLAYIENHVLLNKFRALHSLEEARETAGGYKYEFLDYHYVREVEARMEAEDRTNNEKKPVDINRYYNFEMGFGRLQELMEEATYQYVAFWELLKSDKVTRRRVYEEGVRINCKLGTIRECFQRLSSINPSNIHALVLYSNFMKVIVNTNEPYERNQETIEAVKRTMAQSVKLHREVEKEKYGDNSISAVIIISGERSNIGIIKHCNWKIGEIIGYAPHQLLGQNINVLMPKFIGNMHDDVLRNYLELSQSQFDFVERLVPMIDSRNFMVLARVLSKPLPSLFNGLELVGIFNAVAESSINHPGEAPKYVLYRSDTGQVQALSETCFNEFQYKINKIDEFNETSSELTFSTLFAGAKETDIIESAGFRCKVFARVASTSDVEEVPVEVFQRLQIFYYSVKLRLLSFYTLRSYRQMEDTINGGLEAEPDKIMANENEWEKQPRTERSYNQEKAVKEKFLHEMSKKKGLVDRQPPAFRALRACGYLFFLLALGYSVLLIVLHTQVGALTDYLALTQLSGETEGDLCETVYYARLMHLSFLFPAVGSFAQLQSNISVSVSSLQSGQFSIEKIYLNYGAGFEAVNEWSISNNGKVSTAPTTIDADIFNLVTAASSFNQVPQSSLSFPLVLLDGAKAVTSALQQLFQIRYSGLFESIPKKQDYGDYFHSLFNAYIDSRIRYAMVELGCAMAFLGVFLAVVLPLSLSLLATIDQTILLFGLMSRHEIEREIENCNSFLDIFYQDSYLIWLKKKQRMKEHVLVNPFIADELHLRSNEKGGGTIKAISSNASEAELAPRETPTHHSIVKASLNKIEFLEKELHLRTEAEIMVSQTEQENENQLLRGQVDSSEEDAIYDHLSQDRDKSRLLQVATYLLLMLLLAAYFVGEFLLYRGYSRLVQGEISNVKLGYSNINALKTVRLYSLEALIDNSPFQSYPRPSKIANASYHDLYLAQRQFDTVAFTDTALNSIYYQSLCDPATLSRLAGVVKLFPAASYSAKECEGVLQGVLLEGLRLSIVGYTETLFNLTQLTNVTEVVNGGAFLQARQIQKYIEAPLRVFVQEHQSLVDVTTGNQVQSLVLLFIGFILLLIVLWICLWKKNLMSLQERLRSTRLILGFIPVRVFMKNQKLTREYEKYIGQLMQ